MQFIEQNYLWFIIAGILITMIVVGYIAEKTDFGHKKIVKQVKPKVDKVDKKEEKKEPTLEDLKNVKLGDVVYKDAINNGENSKKENNGELSKDEIDVLSVPLGDAFTTDATQDTTVKPEENNELSKEELDALSVPLGDTSNSDIKADVVENTIDKPIEVVVEPVEEINKPIEEIEKPIEEIEKPIEELNVESVQTEEPTTTVENNLEENSVWEDKPIDETKNDTTNVESEEDIWKF